MLKNALIIAFISVGLYGQSVNIVPLLKRVEKGEIDFVRDSLSTLKKDHPGNPDLLFLEAVITTDAEAAVQKYKMIFREYPNSSYADASIYRLFSYYFARGLYTTAEKYTEQLKENYGKSPYIKLTDRTIPDDEISELNSKPAIPSSPERIEEFKFTIQAGAFLSSSNAQNLNRKFIGEGYHSDIFKKEVGGSILNIVTVGRFPDRVSAQSKLEEINGAYNLRGRIIPLRK